MQIEIFALCDAATVDRGKLNILGTFDTLWVPQVPLVYPQCAVALRVRFSKMERGEHRVIVNFVDIDGAKVLPPAQGPMKIDFPDEQGSGASNLIMNIQGLKLVKLGEYSIDLSVDDQHLASLPLYVRQTLPPHERKK